MNIHTQHTVQHSVVASSSKPVRPIVAMLAGGKLRVRVYFFVSQWFLCVVAAFAAVVVVVVVIWRLSRWLVTGMNYTKTHPYTTRSMAQQKHVVASFA